jgi:predicted GIY-YIG superfamily endonuclease
MSDLVEAKLKKWVVYQMTNSTKKEIYYGISSDLVHRWQDHARDQAASTRKWDFTNDSISINVLEKGMTRKEASEAAHTLELQDPPLAYTIIQTGGW